MVSHAREACGLLASRTRADLDRDRVLELAVVRLLEIVGEAAARVSHETQERYDDLPWPAIIGLRNRLIHGYDSVDLDVLWAIVCTDLPPLVERLEQIVASR